jgi:hypothetical protein
MHSYNSSEILVSVLRSTSFLLGHYCYSGHDPPLSELQRSLGARCPNSKSKCEPGKLPNAFESQ